MWKANAAKNRATGFLAGSVCVPLYLNAHVHVDRSKKEGREGRPPNAKAEDHDDPVTLV